jgi:hypothetical protein
MAQQRPIVLNSVNHHWPAKSYSEGEKFEDFAAMVLSWLAAQTACQSIAAVHFTLVSSPTK